MNSTTLVNYEWKLHFARRSSLVLLALFAAVILYGGMVGQSSRDARVDVIASHYESIDAAMGDWLNDLQQLEQFGSDADVPPWSGSAMDVTFASSMPQRPLADFSIGQSDLLPFQGAISLWDPDIRLFSDYEFADPVGLALGNFDLSKAVIFLLPLLLIVFCFDVIAADRDARRLGLTMAQGISIVRLFWQRLLFRSAVVLLFTLLIAAALLAVGTAEHSFAARLPWFALWCLATLAYGVLWVLIIALVASFNRSSEFNILALLAVWTALTLILPAASSALSEVVYPTPSRLAYLAEAREVENETRLAESEVANQFMLDHPELLVNQTSQIPAFVRSSFLVTSTVDEATRPIVDEFEQALARREQMLGLLRFLSPATVMHSVYNELAGTSARRHQSYLSQAREFKAQYSELVGPNIVAKRPISSEDYAALPSFQFEDESFAEVGGATLFPVTALLIVAVLLFMLSSGRVSRLSPIA